MTRRAELRLVLVVVVAAAKVLLVLVVVELAVGILVRVVLLALLGVAVARLLALVLGGGATLELLTRRALAARGLLAGPGGFVLVRVGVDLRAKERRIVRKAGRRGEG